MSLDMNGPPPSSSARISGQAADRDAGGRIRHLRRAGPLGSRPQDSRGRDDCTSRRVNPIRSAFAKIALPVVMRSPGSRPQDSRGGHSSDRRCSRRSPSPSDDLAVARHHLSPPRAGGRPPLSSSTKAGASSQGSLPRCLFATCRTPVGYLLGASGADTCLGLDIAKQ